MSDEYDIDDETNCPKCNHSPIHSRSCTEILCEGGMIDESEEDFCQEGTIMVTCETCKGTGQEVWCPHCGADLTGKKIFDEEQNDNHEKEKTLSAKRKET